MASMAKFHDLAQWEVEIDEVSTGVYRLHAIRKTGNVFEQTGLSPDDLVQRLREFEFQILQALESRKASG